MARSLVLLGGGRSQPQAAAPEPERGRGGAIYQTAGSYCCTHISHQTQHFQFGIIIK